MDVDVEEISPCLEYACEHTGCTHTYKHACSRNRHEKKKHDCPPPCHVCNENDVVGEIHSESEGGIPSKTSKFKIKEEILRFAAKNFGLTDLKSIVFLLLSCLDARAAADVVMDLYMKFRTFQLILNHQVNSTPEMQQLWANVRQLEKKKTYKDEMGMLSVDLGLRERRQNILDTKFGMNFNADALRYWKEGKVEMAQLEETPGGRGCGMSFEVAIFTMFTPEELESRDTLEIAILTDGGGMDKRNGAIVNKFGRSDSDWFAGNRNRKTALNTTQAIVYAQETPEVISSEFGPLYEKMQQPVVCPKTKKVFTVKWTERNDMKMGCLKLGLGEVYKHPKNLVGPSSCCPLCPSTRYDMEEGKHHFIASQEEFEQFARLDPEDSEFNIRKTNTQRYKFRTLEDLKRKSQEIRELEEKGDKASLDQAKWERKAHGVTDKPPITCVEPKNHKIDIIHTVESVVKRAIKLPIIDCPANGGAFCKNIEFVFEKYAGVKFSENASLAVWKRLDKTRMNYATWVDVLGGFYGRKIGFYFFLFLFLFFLWGGIV